MADLLRPARDAAADLRRQFGDSVPVLALGAHDALSARVAEQAGATAIYMTGFGVAASRIGRPDIGLLGLGEMVDSVRSIVEAVDVPVVADADTGYGSAINVIRTVQMYEAAGVAAIQLEDQSFPKRCGHMDGKTVIAGEEMVRKVEAAVAARRSEDLVIIARTDAIATDDYGTAIHRARQFAAAGADLLFVEAPNDREQIEAMVRDLPDQKLVFNWVGGGRSPGVTLDWLTECGFSLVIMPIFGLLAATTALRETYRAIIETGVPPSTAVSFDDFTDLIGLGEVRSLDARFATSSPAHRGHQGQEG